MTSDVAAPPGRPGPVRSLDPTAAQTWRAARGPVAVVLVVLLTGVLLAVVTGQGASDPLDPDGVDPDGSRALAQVLGDQGVTVERVTTFTQVRAAAGPGDTVLVTAPDLLVEQRARALAALGTDLVLVAPSDPSRITAGVEVAEATEPGVRRPVCDLPAAVRAGPADAGGLAYRVAPGRPDVSQCYARDGSPSLVQVADGGRVVTMLGNPRLLTNDRLAEEGNAALALGLLGAQDRLVWYLPTVGDVPPGTQTSFYALVPDSVWWALGQLLVAVVLLALWRARRLGPVVPEPLPVVVRAAETVEGRGRLYRHSGARGRASATLRAASRARLLPVVGLPRLAEPPALVDAVAGRTGRPAPDVAALLYGSAPPDDAALVRLAGALDSLEREVRHP